MRLIPARRVAFPAACLAVLGGCVAFVLASVPTPLQVSLSSEMPDYTLADPVRLKATLKNISSEPVTIATSPEGVVVKALVKRNGSKLKPRVLKSQTFIQDPLSVAAATLTVLEPGETAEVMLPTSPILFTLDNIPGTTLWTMKPLRRGGYVSNLFELTTPGTYEVTIWYQYLGQDDGHPGIYRKAVKSTTATFSIH